MTKLEHIRPYQVLGIGDDFPEEVRFFMPPAQGAGSLLSIESLLLIVVSSAWRRLVAKAQWHPITAVAASNSRKSSCCSFGWLAPVPPERRAHATPRGAVDDRHQARAERAIVAWDGRERR